MTIIGSSIQVHADTQRLVDGLFQGVELERVPGEKKRLLELVERSRARVGVPLRGRAPRRDHHQPGAVRAPVRARGDHQQRDDPRHPGRGPKEVRPEGVRASAHPPFLPRWLWPDVGGLQRARFIQRNWGGWRSTSATRRTRKAKTRRRRVRRRAPTPRGRLGRRRRRRRPTTDGGLRATGSVVLNIRGDDGRVKISKRVALSALEGTWTDVDAAAARGELEGAAAGRLRDACRTEKDLTRRRDLRLPALAAVCLVGDQPVIAGALHLAAREGHEPRAGKAAGARLRSGRRRDDRRRRARVSFFRKVYVSDIFSLSSVLNTFSIVVAPMDARRSAHSKLTLPMPSAA